jgi:hypothetical protein
MSFYIRDFVSENAKNKLESMQAARSWNITN